ncbi:MAG: ATP-binding protein [Oscillospiraceae bacterium]|nr:ATP-binding protein [Oscillospiraceae bacterium]
MTFSFIEDRRDMESCHFTAMGQVTLVNAGYMEQQLENRIQSGCVNIAIDMGRVTFFSSAGIRTVLGMFKKTKTLGGSLHIENPSENVINVLGMVALDELLFKPKYTPMQEITLPARTDRLGEVLEFVGAAMKRAKISTALQGNITVAVEEMFVNVTGYAYPGEEGSVTIRLILCPGKFTVELRDSGIPFDPLARREPDVSLPADEREIGGLGIFMAKKLMDNLEYRYEKGMNILLMQKDTDTI